MKKGINLKIYERRNEASEIEESIRFSKSLLRDLMRIESSSSILPRVELSGRDFCGNEVEASTRVYPKLFKKLHCALTEAVRIDISNRQKKLDDIPEATIITVDFQRKEIDPDRIPIPNPPNQFSSRIEFHQSGGRIVYRAAHNIAVAIGLERYQGHKIPEYVKSKNLPAFKVEGRRPWFAFEDDLKDWRRKNPDINN